MESSLLNQGLELMLVGMCTVFFLLTLLVIAMSDMGGIVRRDSPQVADGPSDEEVAAITAAVVTHRNKNV